MIKGLEKAEILIEALPYIRSFAGRTLVIKYGGKAMVDDQLKETFAQDVVLMKYVGMNPIVVHGGGPQINAMMERLGLKPKFVRGVRVTDAATMEVVEMVLGGKINKEIVNLIQRHGGRAIGLTGKDGGMLTAQPLKVKGRTGPEKREPHDPVSDMGWAGEIASVDPRLLKGLGEDRIIPVIAPIGADREGRTFNINADSVAGALSASLSAEKLILLSDIQGILDQRGYLIPSLSRKDVRRLIRRGIIKEGMLPKAEAAMVAVEAGVGKAHIIDGRQPHALLLEVFTDKGIGTEIIR